MAAFHDRLISARRASAWSRSARHRAVGQFIVERAREDARRRRLADAAHAGEHLGLRDAAGLEGVGERAHHRALADQIVEGRRAVFARQHAVAVRARACGRSPPAGVALPSCSVASARVVLRHGWFRRQIRCIQRLGGRLTSDPNRSSLGLLPSGPDPVGEWLVHRQPPVSISAERGGNASAAIDIGPDRSGKSTAWTRSRMWQLASATCARHGCRSAICRCRALLAMNDAQLSLAHAGAAPRRRDRDHRPDRADQRELMAEITRASRGAQGRSPIATSSTSRRIGNVVPQLHVHVVARRRDDPAWPKPVWGARRRAAYDHRQRSQIRRQRFAQALRLA